MTTRTMPSPSTRNCAPLRCSGCCSSLIGNHLTLLLHRAALRRVPDWRTPGAFLDRSWELGRQRCLGLQSGFRAPAAGGILQHARVIECAIRLVELRIGPCHRQLGGTFFRGHAAVAKIDCGTVVRASMRLRIRPQTIGASDVKDLLERFRALGPAFDDLYLLQIGAVGILDCPHHQTWSFSVRAMKLAAHRNPAFVAGLYEVLPFVEAVGIVPSSE